MATNQMFVPSDDIGVLEIHSTLMVVGGCVRRSQCAALCSAVTTLFAATKGDTWREKS